MTTPFFSIIIPTYNHAQTIDRTIDSVLEQSCKDFELIIVDDGSTDNTSAILHSKIQSKSFIKYFKKTNGGVCSARNLGEKNSEGKYLVFLDSDDILLKEALQDFYAAAKSDVYDIVFSDMLKINLNNGTKKIIQATDPYGKGKGAGLFLAGAFCIKKTFFEKIHGYDENIQYGENTELKFRVDAENPQRYYTHKISVKYNHTFSGQSKNLKNKIEANHYILDKHKHYFFKNPKVKQYYFQNIAIAQLRLKQVAASQESILKAWKAYPKSFSTGIRMLLFHFPFIAKKIWK